MPEDIFEGDVISFYSRTYAGNWEWWNFFKVQENQHPNCLMFRRGFQGLYKTHFVVSYHSPLAFPFYVCSLISEHKVNNKDDGLITHTHLKRPWCWERLKAGGEGDDRGWDGWMASRTQWAWVWVNSRSWWWTGRPGVLWFMGSQRVRHDWATELNWTK